MLRSLTSAMRRHGPIRFCLLVVRNIVYYVGTRLGGARPDPMELAYDRAHNIETASIREIGSLRIKSPNDRYAVRYQPSDRELVQGALAQLDIDWRRYTFVDYGCGKGLVLLIASAFPFNEVIGVEFAQELREIAGMNIASYKDPGQKCHRLSVVLADAVDYDPPRGPLVCYFYNPFDAPVMQQVVERLEARATTSREPVIVVYLNPRHEHLFDASGCWRVDFRNDAYSIIRFRTTG